MIPTVHRHLLALAILVGSTANGAIYRCIEQPDAVLYSQFPCKNAELVPERQLSVIETPQLSESERLMLKQIKQNSVALELASHKRAKQRHRQREKRNAERTALCRQAVAGINNLRTRKRAGYSLSDATVLAAREVTLKRQQDLNC